MNCILYIYIDSFIKILPHPRNHYECQSCLLWQISSLLPPLPYRHSVFPSLTFSAIHFYILCQRQRSSQWWWRWQSKERRRTIYAAQNSSHTKRYHLLVVALVTNYKWTPDDISLGISFDVLLWNLHSGLGFRFNFSDTVYIFLGGDRLKKTTHTRQEAANYFSGRKLALVRRAPS